MTVTVYGMELEDGDLAPEAQQMVDEYIETRDRIVELVGQMISLEGMPEQEHAYAELVQLSASLTDLDTRMEAYEAQQVQA